MHSTFLFLRAFQANWNVTEAGGKQEYSGHYSKILISHAIENPQVTRLSVANAKMLIIGNVIILLEPSSRPHVQGSIIKISSENNENIASNQSQMCLQ